VLQFNSLGELIERAGKDSDWLEISDSLVMRYRYNALDTLYACAKSAIVKSYIELLMDIKNGTAQEGCHSRCLLQDSKYRLHLSRLAVNHPRRLAIYMVSQLHQKQIVALLADSEEHIQKVEMGNLIIEIIKVTVETTRDNEVRNNLVRLAMGWKCLLGQHVFYLAKAIATGHISAGIDDQFTKEIFELLPKHVISDCRDTHSIINSNDKVQAAKSIITKRLFARTVQFRDIDGTWKVINRESSIQERGILISGCIWGDKEVYLDALPEMGWPTLSSSLNLANKEQKQITFYAHTTTEAATYLKEIIDKMNLTCRAVIDTSILGSDSAALQNRGYTYIDTIVRAIETQSTVVGWSPDAYYGEGLDEMVRNCPKGGMACAPVIRVGQKGFYEFHRRWKASGKGIISNSQLAGKAFDGSWYHPYQKLYVENISTQFTSYMIQDTLKLYSWTQNAFVYKPDRSFFELMAKNCRPRYSNPVSENLAQFLDHDGFHSLNERSLAYRCPSSQKFILIEPSHDKQYNPFNEKMLFPAQCRASVYPTCSYDIVLSNKHSNHMNVG
jgi:hypothetical protein